MIGQRLGALLFKCELVGCKDGAFDTLGNCLGMKGVDSKLMAVHYAQQLAPQTWVDASSDDN